MKNLKEKHIVFHIFYSVPRHNITKVWRLVIYQWRGRAWDGLSWLRIGTRLGVFVKALIKI